MRMYEDLINVVGKENLKLDEKMSAHTTLGIGGNAKVLIEPKNEKEINSILSIAKEYNKKVYIIGRGSNILVSDDGLDGIVIKIANKFSSIKIEGNSMIIKSGTPIAEVSKLAMKKSLKGIEFASGIPGTVGGAIVMNAGAYGGEMKDIVEWVTVMKEDGSIEKIYNQDMQFSYRKSLLTKEDKWIVLEVKINLDNGDKEEILNEMMTRNEKRVSSQPLDKNNCGSTFKRPKDNFAGKLIEDCGLKGFNHNGVEISSKHAGFIVNNGKSTAKDMLYVMEVAKKSVKEKFGITLEEEVKIFK